MRALFHFPRELRVLLGSSTVMMVMVVVCGVRAAEHPAEDAAVAALRKLIDPLVDDGGAIRSRVADLVERLSHDDFLARESATAQLSSLPPEIKSYLIRSAPGRDLETRVRTKLAIGAISRRAANIGEGMNDAIDVLLAGRDVRLVPLLLELLAHDDSRVRYYAEYGIRRATGQGFVFSVMGGEDLRRAQLAEWERWWQGAAASFEFRDAGQPVAEPGIIVVNDLSNEVALLDFDGEVLWSHKLDSVPYTAQVLPGGGYVVGHAAGLTEYDKAHKEVWSNKVAGLGQSMIYDLERLENGNTLISYVSDGHVSEIDREGKVIWQLEGLSSPGAARRLPNGNTLISENHGGKVIEVNRAKEVVWSAGDLSNPADVSPTPHGNVLVAEWGAKRAFEADRDGNQVWAYQSETEIGGAYRLADGNTLIAQEKELVIVNHRGEVLRTIPTALRKYGKVRVVAMPEMLPSP